MYTPQLGIEPPVAPLDKLSRESQNSDRMYIPNDGTPVASGIVVVVFGLVVDRDKEQKRFYIHQDVSL